MLAASKQGWRVGPTCRPRLRGEHSVPCQRPFKVALAIADSSSGEMGARWRGLAIILGFATLAPQVVADELGPPPALRDARSIRCDFAVRYSCEDSTGSECRFEWGTTKRRVLLDNVSIRRRPGYIVNKGSARMIVNGSFVAEVEVTENLGGLTALGRANSAAEMLSVVPAGKPSSDGACVCLLSYHFSTGFAVTASQEHGECEVVQRYGE